MKGAVILKKQIRIISAFLCCVMIFSANSSALADAPKPTVDEALYVNLNYYGAFKEASVVKSYSPNGNSTITDHGIYTDIINKTNYVKPKIDGNTVTFQFDKNKIPNRFYFEGKTDGLPVELPWSFNIDYKLNGASIAADKLPGKSGMVEMGIHIKPNTEASDYFKNNMILTIGTMVDADKITGLEAPGAQTQAIGNMEAVLFFALPGETQDFTLSIGSDDFSFSGLFFMMVPGTAQQMDQITDLRDAKDTVEGSADAVSDSLDVILGTMYGLQGGLSSTASGLKGLDDARKTISSGSDAVYDNADSALTELDTLTQSLTPLSNDLTSTKTSVGKINTQLGDAVDTLNDLKTQLEDTRNLITKTQEDMQAYRDMISEFDKLKGNRSSLYDDLTNDITKLQNRMDDLTSVLSDLKISKNLPSLDEIDDITFSGMTPTQARSAASYLSSQVQTAVQALEEKDSSLTDAEALQEVLATLSDEQKLLYQMYNDGDLEIQLGTIESTNDVLDQTNSMISSVNSSVKTIANQIDSISSALKEITKQLGTDSYSSKGDSSLLDDMSEAIGLLDSYCDVLDNHSDDATNLLDDFDSAGNIGSEVTSEMDTLLGNITDLYGTVNNLEPTIESALTNSSTILNNTATTLSSTKTFLSSLKTLMKNSQDSLDSGTQKTLNGLINTLNQSIKGLAQTGTLQKSKDTIKDTIDDKWDEYTGEDSNLLNADPDAAAVSFTSSENAAPNSIQIILRTSEITEDDDDNTKDIDESYHAEGNIFTRILNIFKNIISAIREAVAKS